MFSDPAFLGKRYKSFSLRDTGGDLGEMCLFKKPEIQKVHLTILSLGNKSKTGWVDSCFCFIWAGCLYKQPFLWWFGSESSGQEGEGIRMFLFLSHHPQLPSPFLPFFWTETRVLLGLCFVPGAKVLGQLRSVLILSKSVYPPHSQWKNVNKNTFTHKTSFSLSSVLAKEARSLSLEALNLLNNVLLIFFFKELLLHCK